MVPVKEELKNIIREQVPHAVVTDEKSFERPFQELGVDSLDVMTVFLSVQEKFGLEEIPDADIERLKTPSLLAEYIETKLKEKGSS